MSFPLAPAMFDADEELQNTDIDRKKHTRNKTIKKNSKTNVASIISKIHENTSQGDNNGDVDGMVDFIPPPPPHSAGGERVEARKGQKDTVIGNPSDEGVKASTANTGDGALTPELFGNIQSTQVEDYYRKNVPYYTQMSEQPITNRNDLMKKMDKILYLLEEQQDHKTGHATEELILYSFVGVFIIFIVDSFARAGKYVR